MWLYHQRTTSGKRAGMARTRRVAIITAGVRIGREKKGCTRFLSIASSLAAAGLEVELITSAFQFWEQQQRKTDDPSFHRYPFKVAFIDEPGYERSIERTRIKSHKTAAKNLKSYLGAAAPFDLVYCEIPPNEVACAAARYAHKRAIPFIVDVNDHWFETMRVLPDVPLIGDLASLPFTRDARVAYQYATAVVGTSDEYAAHPFTHRPANIERLTAYVGNELAAFDTHAHKNKALVDKGAGEFWVTYTGTLDTVYDIGTLLHATAVLKQRGYDAVRTLIIGSGPSQERLEELAKTLDANITFTGYREYPMMAAYLIHSDVVVNSFIKRAPQPIASKIADYVAAGKPVVNTNGNAELKGLVDRAGIGVNVEAEDVEALAGAIASLHDDPARRAAMGTNARQLAREHFDRATSYQRIVALVRRQLGEPAG